MAVFIFYFRAVLLVLFGAFLSPFGLLVAAAAGASGFGIANERRWGYNLALVVSFAEVLALLRIVFGYNADGFFISLMFAVALVALLLHPQSRDYQRIWFS